MSAGTPARSGPDALLGSIVLGAAAVALGLAGGLPSGLGAVIGAVGVTTSAICRSMASARWKTLPLVPAILAISVEVILATPVPATELLAGATGVAFLFWVAEDPHRPVGGGRRGVTPIALVALAVGFSLAIVLVLPRGPSDVAIAGGLLALAMVLVAILLARTRFDAGRAPLSG